MSGVIHALKLNFNKNLNNSSVLTELRLILDF